MSRAGKRRLKRRRESRWRTRAALDRARSPQRRCRPVALAHRLALDQMLLERLAHQLRAGAAPADQAHAAADQALDRRDADLGLEAVRDHLAFVERQQDRAAHALSPCAAAVSRPLAVSSSRARSCARTSQLAALRSRVRRSLAVIMVTDFRRSAEARSRHVAAVSLCLGAVTEALVSKGMGWTSPLMGMHLLASGKTRSRSLLLADGNVATEFNISRIRKISTLFMLSENKACRGYVLIISRTWLPFL